MPFLDDSGNSVERGDAVTAQRTVELASADGPTHTVKLGSLVSVDRVVSVKSKSAGVDEDFTQAGTDNNVAVVGSVNDDNNVDVTFREPDGGGALSDSQSEDRDTQIVVEGF